tara:strand:- start:65 stop:985 length:921 start_codon:yes stop_codon:yes gene_type:complete
MNNNKITLSINPTYLCNFRCNFCYLTPEQLSDKNKLDLGKLKTLLDELKINSVEIKHVDLYGGEVALLGDDYLSELADTVHEFYKGKINVVTNLSKIIPFFKRNDVDLSVSYDFEARQGSDLVLSNMISVNKDLAVLMLASPELLRIDPELMIQTLNFIKNVKSVEIKPYSSNQANQLEFEYTDFEELVKNIIESPQEKKFEFINEKNIIACLDKESNSFSDDHLYITPEGKFSVLEFDKDGKEFFLELDSYQNYLDWCKEEKNKVQSNSFCKKCQYLGHCLTEHYKEVRSLDNSCNGFYNLLEWY